VAIVPWELGPLITSKRARREPTPWFSLCCDSSVNFHIARLLSTSLQHIPYPVAFYFTCNQDKRHFLHQMIYFRYLLLWERLYIVPLCAQKFQEAKKEKKNIYI
jgi:hypothetical protein